MALDETTKANPGMVSFALDVEDVEAIKVFAAKMAKEFPALNAVIVNAGPCKLRI